MTEINRPLVLVVDDDPDFQALAEFMLSRQDCETCCVNHPDELKGPDAPRDVKLILLDWQLGKLDGTKLIDPLRRRFPAAPIIFVTGHSSPEIAAASIKLGAFDFLTKPLDPPKLMVTVAQALSHHELLAKLQKLEPGTDEGGFEGIIGSSPQMQTVYSVIRNVAPTDVSVMICGESGTGKELVASAIHQQSDRASSPFVPINMASIPADLAEATLFGHEKGAFTGADKSRPGAVGEAAGGTLFLDEITEMQIDLQSKLLRFLQERKYRQVGANSDQKSDVRIISATNRDPMAAVKDSLLREDLFYRLNVVPIEIPALRERDGDIPLIAAHALKNYAREYGKLFESISPNALTKLQSYDWPGNVRQLVHVIQRCVVLNEGKELEGHMLPVELEGLSSGEDLVDFATGSASNPSVEVQGDHLMEGQAQPSPLEAEETIVPLEQLEREAIAHALRVCKGSAYQAASRLGISPATMYRRIKRYGLEADD